MKDALKEKQKRRKGIVTTKGDLKGTYPKRISRFSLFSQIFYATLGISLFLLFLITVIFTLFVNQYWLSYIEESLRVNVNSVADDVEDLSRASGEGGDVGISMRLIANILEISSESLNADIFVADENGAVFFCKEMQGNQPLDFDQQVDCETHQNMVMSQELMDAATSDGYVAVDKLEEAGGKRQIVACTRIELEGTLLGYACGIIPYDDVVGSVVTKVMNRFAIAGLIAILLVSFMAYLFAYRMARPLSDMARLTQQYAKGDFSERINLKRLYAGREMVYLARSLNRMADELDLLEDSRQGFVANVSHELKTPMTTIGGFVDGMLDGTIPLSEHKKYLRIISTEVKRLTDLVVTMLTLSKIEVGGAKLSYSMVDMNSLIIQTFLSFEKTIESAGYYITGLEKMPSVRVMADKDMLYQVLYNLIDNATKFTNAGGTIHVGMREDTDKVVVSVSNTGDGIPRDKVDRIFERFYKQDESRSEYVKGVGLGLNLVKNIVELHGGEVIVRSDPGTMTTFTFWIPKSGPAEEKS